MKASGKEEAKKRIMTSFLEEDEQIVAQPPKKKATTVEPVRMIEDKPIQREKYHYEPPAEIPEPLGILSKIEQRKKSLRADPDWLLKGLYYERSVIQDLEEFASLVGREPSRVANAILKAALAVDTAQEEFLPFLKRMIDRRSSR